MPADWKGCSIHQEVAQPAISVESQNGFREQWRRRYDCQLLARSLRIEPKGKRRVAGHEGLVYAVYGIDKDKPKESADFVMSSEPALQPVGRAMEQFMIAMIVPIGALIGDAAAEMVADTRAVFAKGAPLDLGGRFVLVSFEPAEVTQEAVTLPAKPQTIAEIVAGLKGGMTEPQAEAAPAAE